MRLFLFLAVLLLGATEASGSHRRNTKTELVSIGIALDAFKEDCGRYPTAGEGLAALVNRPTTLPTEKWRGPYFGPGLPSDSWGNDYVYRCPGVHFPQGYDLYSLGRDGKSKSGGGDADDINNWDPESPRRGEVSRGDDFGVPIDKVILDWGIKLWIIGIFSFLIIKGWRMFKRRPQETI